MNRLLVCSLVLGATIAPLFAGKPESETPKPQKITSITGTTYEKAVITSVTPSAVTILHDSGVAKVLLKDLPPDLQKQYDYDPKKASSHEAEKEKKTSNEKATPDKSQDPAKPSPSASPQKVKEVSLIEAVSQPSFKPSQILSTPVGAPSTPTGSTPTSIPSGW